ncbi:unnamed protein product [Clavelina lepadiformis]|uniref:Uncharacterized protein n=1 Tax=Clavelina lepadiformis TaxID=159417 RepID=A0ABP0FKD9_CLALP
MLTTLDNKCNSNVERQCHETEDPSPEKELNLFLRSQKQLWPTRKTNLFDAMQTVNAFRISLNSRKKTLPSLLVSYNEAGTMKTFIVADSIHFRCKIYSILGANQAPKAIQDKKDVTVTNHQKHEARETFILVVKKIQYAREIPVIDFKPNLNTGGREH